MTDIRVLVSKLTVISQVCQNTNRIESDNVKTLNNLENLASLESRSPKCISGTLNFLDFLSRFTSMLLFGSERSKYLQNIDYAQSSQDLIEIAEGTNISKTFAIANASETFGSFMLSNPVQSDSNFSPYEHIRCVATIHHHLSNQRENLLATSFENSRTKIYAFDVRWSRNKRKFSNPIPVGMFAACFSRFDA